MSDHDMKLPDTIRTFKLLDGANLKDDERKMALTVASDLKYEPMKSALKRIFTRPQSPNSTTAIDQKQEEAFYNKRRPFRKQGQYKQTVKKDKMNPVNKSGHISRCLICDSKMHWASQCPHAQNNTNKNGPYDRRN